MSRRRRGIWILQPRPWRAGRVATLVVGGLVACVVAVLDLGARAGAQVVGGVTVDSFSWTADGSLGFTGIDPFAPVPRS